MTGAKGKPVALVIDDETQIRRLLRIALEAEGYAVYEAKSGQEGLTTAVFRRPEVIILDLGLPDMDGTEVLKRLREWSKVPVLILSVREDVQEKVTALDLGADDYLSKPFHPDELMARLRVLRRHSPLEPEEPVFESGLLRIDYLSRRVTVHGKEIHLTATEYTLLRVLARHEGRVVTHRQLLREVWGPNAEERSQYLRVYMNHLRKKIEADPTQPSMIKTESGIGYRMISEKV
ncbi:MAG: response regulator [Candidatus Aureabacteria bacterium]|jgi:two-component system, OmpR family, KDP operon response regulator KdpE|nr:response regulator [Candidatus Auribacterota bacterium]